MLLVFVILLIVSVCVTIVGTYFLLNAENYHWPWTAFGLSASTGAYVFAYAVRACVGLLRCAVGCVWSRVRSRTAVAAGAGCGPLPPARRPVRRTQ